MAEAVVSYKPRLVPALMTKGVIDAKYAVRGCVVARAHEVASELAQGSKKYPFDSLIYCNIGNPQGVKQPPLSYVRDVLSGVVNPRLLEVEGLFESDVISRCKRILGATRAGSIGAYTRSEGLQTIRESVATFIRNRDKTCQLSSGVSEAADVEVDTSRIFLTNGASHGITAIMKCLVSDPSHGVLLPIPQYPLYSATLTLLNATRVDYDLQFEHGWSLNLKGIEESIAAASAKGIDVRAIVVINPGNPTGACLSEADIRGIIGIAKANNLVILADEVYQTNVYDPSKPFVSFRAVLKDMQEDSVELVSFHSVSKGIFGECGLRGGYLQMENVNAEGLAQFRKLQTISLCPNTIGQTVVDIMCNPPTPDGPSYKKFTQECSDLYESLKRRAKCLSEALNGIGDGMECQVITGAMYAFPKITLSKAVIEKANAEGILPDEYYCLRLLEEAGIVTVPGTGFGMKKEGTESYHFRTTFLPPESEMDSVVAKLRDFHSRFIAEFADSSSPRKSPKKRLFGLGAK